MATGDILAVRISGPTSAPGVQPQRYNGWVAEIDVDTGGAMTTGGTYDFGLGANRSPDPNGKAYFDITSPSFDQTATAGAAHRGAWGTQWIRKVEPNQALAEESVVGSTLTIRVSLSDFVYSGDTLILTLRAGLYTQGGHPTSAYTGAVTNGSTLTHTQCVGRWGSVGFQAVGGVLSPEFVAFHRFGRSGCPVACVVFTATDGTTTLTQTVTHMVKSKTSSDASANTCLVYAPTFLMSSFVQGAVVTVNAKAYPWIGNAGSALDTSTGVAPPSEQLGPLKYVCDKNGTYGGGVAVVNPAGTTWISGHALVRGDQATAESAYGGVAANAYKTVGDAIQAIKDYNNTVLSPTRANPGGGMILLATATNVWDTVAPGDLGAQDAWVTITRLSTVTRANAAITSGLNTGIGVRKCRLYDITVSGSSVAIVKSGDITTDVLWVDNCTLNAGAATAPFYQWRLQYATRNTVTALANGFRAFSTDKSPWALVRENVGPTYTTSAPGVGGGTGIVCDGYCVIGNYNCAPVAVWGPNGNPGGAAVGDGCVWAFNEQYALSQEWTNGTQMDTDPATGYAVVQGMAIIQNVVEIIIASPLLRVYGDGAGKASNNIILWHNTFVGDRLNLAYNDGTAGAPPANNALYLDHLNYSQKNNIFESWNNKDDTFVNSPTTADPNRTGSWKAGYNVGSEGNQRRTTANPEWAGEFFGIYDVEGGLLGFVRDASHDNGAGGTGRGNGDYHPTNRSASAKLVDTPLLPYDLDGVARLAANGTSGAFELAVSTDVTLPQPVKVVARR